jgi:hypothetical protein
MTLRLSVPSIPLATNSLLLPLPLLPSLSILPEAIGVGTASGVCFKAGRATQADQEFELVGCWRGGVASMVVVSFISTRQRPVRGLAFA